MCKMVAGLPVIACDTFRTHLRHALGGKYKEWCTPSWLRRFSESPDNTCIMPYWPELNQSLSSSGSKKCSYLAQ